MSTPSPGTPASPSPVSFKRIELAAAALAIAFLIPIAARLVELAFLHSGLSPSGIAFYLYMTLIPELLSEILLLPAIFLFATARPLSTAGRAVAAICYTAVCLILLCRITAGIITALSYNAPAAATSTSTLVVVLLLAFSRLPQLFLIAAAGLFLFHLGLRSRHMFFALLSAGSLGLCAFPLACLLLLQCIRVLFFLHWISLAVVRDTSPFYPPLYFAHLILQFFTWLAIALCALLLARQNHPLSARSFPLT